jgi:hypothetical protein
LEAAIAAKEKELAALRAEADALRKQLAPDGAGEKVYKSVAELLADLPKDKYPKGGENGIPEDAACSEWMTKNVVGRVIEWKDKIDRVSFEPTGFKVPGLEMHVWLTRGGETEYQALVDGSFQDQLGLVLSDKLAFGPNVSARVILDRPPLEGGSGPLDKWKTWRLYPLYYFGVGGEAAKKVRDLAGKEVTFRAKVVAADVTVKNLRFRPGPHDKTGKPAPDSSYSGLVIRLSVGPPTVDGIDLTPAKK